MTFRISADESLKFTTKGTDRLSQKKRELGIRKDGRLGRFLLLGLAFLMLAMALSVPADGQTFSVTCPQKVRLNQENTAKVSRTDATMPVAAIEFKINLDLASWSGLLPNKPLTCVQNTGADDHCVMVGLNADNIPAADLAELKWTPTATPITLNVTGLLGARPDGSGVTLTDPTSCTISLVYGDANGDGSLSCPDLQSVVDQVLKKIPAAEGDQNGDGVINVLDAQIVVNEMIAAQVTSCP